MNETEKEDYIDLITKTLRENEKFSKENTVAKDLYHEIIELVNDVIDLLGQLPDKNKFLSSAKYNFILTNLMPSSYSILLDFLAGNIPPCFIQMRTTVEFLIESFVADKDYPTNEFFYEKLQRVQKNRDRKNIGLYKFIKNIDSEAAKLWSQCSEWAHAKTLSKKLVEQISDIGVTSWSTIVPMPYDHKDERLLGELLDSIKQLRKILNRILEKWI